MRYALHITAMPITTTRTLMDVDVQVVAIYPDAKPVNYPMYREVVTAPNIENSQTMELWANMMVRQIARVCEDAFMAGILDGSVKLPKPEDELKEK